MAQYEPLESGRFRDSFLLEVAVVSWPNDYEFLVWSSVEENAYRISLDTVLEFHYVRTGAGPLSGLGEGIPLDDIYRTQNEEYDYWMNQIAANRTEGCDDGASPICLEFSSHLFANRNRQPLIRNRNIGILVACRNARVDRDDSYCGPRPFPFKIPAADE